MTAVPWWVIEALCCNVNLIAVGKAATGVSRSAKVQQQWGQVNLIVRILRCASQAWEGPARCVFPKAFSTRQDGTARGGFALPMPWKSSLSRPTLPYCYVNTFKLCIMWWIIPSPFLTLPAAFPLHNWIPSGLLTRLYTFVFSLYKDVLWLVAHFFPLYRLEWRMAWKSWLLGAPSCFLWATKPFFLISWCTTSLLKSPIRKGEIANMKYSFENRYLNDLPNWWSRSQFLSSISFQSMEKEEDQEKVRMKGMEKAQRQLSIIVAGRFKGGKMRWPRLSLGWSVRDLGYFFPEMTRPLQLARNSRGLLLATPLFLLIMLLSPTSEEIRWNPRPRWRVINAFVGWGLK